MKIELVVVGRTQTRYLVDAIGNYCDRINRYVSFQLTELRDLKSTRSLSRDRQKEMEGEMILGAVAGADWVVLLDERGDQPTSRDFSRFIEQQMSMSRRRLVFVVGGPYGFSGAVYARANQKLSLSRMTFSHEMVRLFFVEQLYRAMTIMRGEPYHHD